MKRSISWLSMLVTVRATALVVALTAIALLLVPQMQDMLIDISDYSQHVTPGIGFHAALLLTAFFAWHWSRAALSARFDLDDTHLARNNIQPRLLRDEGASVDVSPFKLLPRLLFVATAFIGIIAALRSSDVLDAAIIVAWSAGAYSLLEHRLQIQESLRRLRTFSFLFKSPAADPAAEPPKKPKQISMGKAFRLIFRRAPFGIWFAAIIFAFALGLYLVSGIASFVPSQFVWRTIVSGIGRVFAGPSAALLCLGLAIGPLTVLTFVADRRELHFELYGFPIRIRSIPVLVVLAALSVGTAQLVSLHDVRVASADRPHRDFEQRQTLETLFETWRNNCAKGETGTDGVKNFRPIIVAVSGGASRAGLWAARVLIEVDAIAAANKKTSIFAVSSVSGGSVGAAGYLAALHREGNSGCSLNWPVAPPPGPDSQVARQMGFVREALRADALGPTMVGTLLGDVPRSILGLPAELVRRVLGFWKGELRLRGGDRAEALERAFEDNWERSKREWKESICDAANDEIVLEEKAPGKSQKTTNEIMKKLCNTSEDKKYSPRGEFFKRQMEEVGKVNVTFADSYLSLFPGIPGNGKIAHPANAFTPLWLANGTDAQNGDRILTAPFKFTVDQFPAARDALKLLKSDIPISTAIDNTSRFPFLSPSGELASVKPGDERYATQIVDGGYFENEGLETALDLAIALKTIAQQEKDPTKERFNVEPIIVQVTSDADPGIEEKRIVRCGGVFNDDTGISMGAPRPSQFLAPVIGLNSTRGGHAHVALRDAFSKYCAHDKEHQSFFFHFYLYGDETHTVPLNWVLSPYIANYIWDSVLEKCGNRRELDKLTNLLPPEKK
jgi:hypothetical protein